MSLSSRIDLVFRRFCSCALALGALALALPIADCSDDTASGGSGTGGAAAGGAGSEGGADAFAACDKGEMEADFVADTPLTGPGVDAETGELAEGSYFIATTYLAMKPGKLEQVIQLSAPAIGELQSSPGFVALSTAKSDSCLALRTMTVWASEEEMYAFVTGPAHATAMAAMSDVSRGSSNTISWAGTAADTDWAVAIEKLGTQENSDK